MAAGAISSALVPQHDVRWKWLLLTLCALSFVAIVANVLDYLGFVGQPWDGWWEVSATATTRPFIAAFASPLSGGTSARAGIRAGDWIDLREQSSDARFGLFAQPMARRLLTLVLHRGTHTFAAQVVPRTTWEGDARLKVWQVLPGWITSTLLVDCGFLIAIRRASVKEGRVLALILLLEAAATVGAFVVPDAAASAFSAIASYACGLIAFLLLIALSSQFGVRTTQRRVFEGCAYGVLVLNVADFVAFAYGVFTLRLDPLKHVPEYYVGVFTGAGMTATLFVALAVTVLIVAAAAAASTERSQRPRAGWLLLPLPVSLLASNGISVFLQFTQTWAAEEVIYGLSTYALLVGAIAVTYALLKRRVLDLQFVLSRSIVVAIVSLIVLTSFVLLEWMLGTVLAGVSHATGVIANAALALVLGVSLNFIHKRVDASVDAVLFRKRHQDERALLDFSKEAAYVTEPEALLDLAIAKVQKHTDARNAAVFLNDNGSFTHVRSFGQHVHSVGENDSVILALKTWHKPLDPHHYATLLEGALAVPMVARGRLFGVLLLGERAGGEAYTPDEVEALSQLAHGVGTALDALSFSARGTGDGVLTAVLALREQIRCLPDAIASAIATDRELRSQR